MFLVVVVVVVLVLGDWVLGLGGGGRTNHSSSEQRKDFQAVEVCAARAHEVVPGCGGEFGFPGFEVCAWPESCLLVNWYLIG